MGGIRWTISELKEILLAMLALLWGVLFLLPGNVFTDSPTQNFSSLYTEDWVWGSILVLLSLFAIFGPRTRWLRFRKYVHLYFWFFWLGMAVLVIVRSMANGIHVVDILIVSPYMTIAVLHAILYARLASER